MRGRGRGRGRGAVRMMARHSFLLSNFLRSHREELFFGFFLGGKEG